MLCLIIFSKLDIFLLRGQKVWLYHCKKGSINDVNNYRGITLLNCVDKLFTMILNNRLYDWGDTYTRGL